MNDKLGRILDIWDFLMTFRDHFSITLVFSPEELLTAFVIDIIMST
jgi:hypothetical protein